MEPLIQPQRRETHVRPVLTLFTKKLAELTPVERDVFTTCNVLNPGNLRTNRLGYLRLQGINVEETRSKVSATLERTLGHDRLVEAILYLKTMQNTKFMHP